MGRFAKSFLFKGGGGSVDGQDIKPNSIEVQSNGSAASPSLRIGTAGDGLFRSGSARLSIASSGNTAVDFASTQMNTQGTLNALGAVQVRDRLIYTPEAIKTANYTVDNSDSVIGFDDEGGSALTATLPPSPANGQAHRLINAGTSALSVARNGNTIDGDASDDTIAADNAALYIFIPGDGWRRFG